MIRINTVLNKNIPFGVRLQDNTYDKDFKEEPLWHGVLPDEFIIKKLKENFPNPDGIEVLDIGAGNGRNAIPIAQKGYHVTASEICDAGKELIKNKVAQKRLTNVSISSLDILSLLGYKIEKFNFALMSHVAQHFNLEDINRALYNTNKMLKENGIFIFDALIRNKGNENRPYSEIKERMGNADFKEVDILEAAKKQGFDTLEITDYAESKEGHARYIDSFRWGRDSEPIFNEPVTLKWIVLKKKR